MSRTRICAGEKIELADVPGTVKILPLGLVKSSKGDFVVDEEAYQSIQKVFKARGIDIVIDYEHQTLADVQAPAGGWIKELELGEDAIIAKVEWTPRAQEYLRNKEYRYLSPVVLVRDSDNKAIALNSVALTNTPAINGMFAIVNKAADTLDIEDTGNNAEEQGGNRMDLKKLAQLLGLPETATEDEVLSRIQALTASGTELVANKTILGLLGLPETAKTEEVTASIVALRQGDADIKLEVRALKEQMRKKEVQELVEGALQGGKISADLKEWATQYALKDTDGFRAFLDKTPQMVPMGTLEIVDAPKTGGLTVDTKILKSLGITEDDVKKFTE